MDLQLQQQSFQWIFIHSSMCYLTTSIHLSLLNSRLCLLNSAAQLGSLLILFPCTTGMLLRGANLVVSLLSGIIVLYYHCLMSEISCFMYFVFLTVYGIRLSPSAVIPLWIEAEDYLFISGSGFQILSSWAFHLIFCNDHPSF